MCNHTKQSPKNWSARKERYKEREMRALEKVSKIKKKAKSLQADLKRLREEKREKIKKTKEPFKVRARYRKRIESKRRQLENIKLREVKAQAALVKLRTQLGIATKNRTWNLGTSQKSYIDPRVFYQWGKRVDYDVLERFYSKTLRRKFMWVRNEELD